MRTYSPFFANYFYYYFEKVGGLLLQFYDNLTERIMSPAHN